MRIRSHRLLSVAVLAVFWVAMIDNVLGDLRGSEYVFANGFETEPDLNVKPIGYWPLDDRTVYTDPMPNVANPGFYDMTTLGYGTATPDAAGISGSMIRVTDDGHIGPHIINNAAFRVDFVWMAWVSRNDDRADLDSIYRHGLTGFTQTGWSLIVRPADGYIEVRVGNNVAAGGSTVVITSTTAVLSVLDDMHHIAVRYSGTTWTLYVDGAVDGTGVKAITWDATSDDQRNLHFIDNLIGTIDEVIICPDTLTDQSITNAYKAGIAHRRTTYAP